MVTTMFFDETIRDQGGRGELAIELGRSSYFSEDCIYLV